MKTITTNHEHEVGTRNVYDDLGYENHEEMLAKAELTRRLAEAIDRLGLTQSAAAALIGVDQPTLSKLLRGRFRSVTLDRLSGMLLALGCNVTIVVAATGESSPDGLRRGRLAVAG